MLQKEDQLSRDCNFCFSILPSLDLLFDWIPFTTNSYGPNSEGLCWFRDHNCSQHTSSCTETGWEEAWLFTVPVGFVGIVIMLYFLQYCSACWCIISRMPELIGGHWLNWPYSLPPSSSPSPSWSFCWLWIITPHWQLHHSYQSLPCCSNWLYW